MTSESDRSRIFLSYRRSDSAGHAGRLYDALQLHCPDFELFMDVESTEYGLDFTQVLAGELERCHIAIILIGRQWLHAADNQGRRRLESPSDYVRQEVEAVLHRDIRVVPVLVQGAEMPATEDLPESLAALTFRHALELSDKRWQYDVQQLVSALTRSLDADSLRAGTVSDAGLSRAARETATLQRDPNETNEKETVELDSEPAPSPGFLRAPLKETCARLATLPGARGAPCDDDAYLTLEALGLAEHGAPTDLGRSYLDALRRDDKSRQAETLRTLLSTHDHVMQFLSDIGDDTSYTSDFAQKRMAHVVGIAGVPDQQSARRWLEWLLRADLLTWQGERLGLTEDGMALARRAREAV